MGQGTETGRRIGRRIHPSWPALPETQAGRFSEPVPQCVDFKNTPRTNKNSVRELGRLVVRAFSRYEIVTSCKRGVRPCRGHYAGGAVTTKRGSSRVGPVDV